MAGKAESSPGDTSSSPAPSLATEKRRSSAYWLMKTEPGEWSWADQRSNGGISVWDGVKNRQAQNYLKSMHFGDHCFFYHSGADRHVIGVVEVIKPWYELGSDEGGAVDVREVGELRRRVSLAEIKKAAEKGDESLKGLKLLKQPRLSVVPVPEEAWERICDMGGGVAPSTAEEDN